MKLAAPVPPSYVKMGFFGHTGTGKTWTAALILSRFVKKYCPKTRIAMFDTETGGGYIAPLVKKITGKDPLVFTGHAFSELLEFAAVCRKGKHVALLDSVTHPWRSLMADYLDAKKSRVKGAGGRPDSVRLALSDWGPIKDMWAKFADQFRYDPVHWCIVGREGDVWSERQSDEGKTELHKSGVKMKTEVETGYEPSLLIRMTLETPVGDGAPAHRATVIKDRFGLLTGQHADEPDIQFFAPYFNALTLGGKQAAPSGKAKPVFEQTHGPNWSTVQARRISILEEIKNDILLVFPGQTGAEKQAKIKALRVAFGTGSWTKLETDHRMYTPEVLAKGRAKLRLILKDEEKTNGQKSG